MAQRNSRIKPKDRNIDAKMTILGFVGFTVLAGVFFVVGLYGIGPMIRSHTDRPTPPSAPPTYLNPEPSPRSTTPKEPTPEPLGIDLEVRERSENEETPGTEGESAREASGENAEAVSPQAEEPRTTAPSGRTTGSSAPTKTAPTEGLERPRTATETPRSSSTTSTDKRIYRVQAGTFANRENADKLAADLRKDGYRAEIRTAESDGRVLHRVQLGGYSDRQRADVLVNDLTSKGYSPAVVEERLAD